MLRTFRIKNLLTYSLCWKFNSASTVALRVTLKAQGGIRNLEAPKYELKRDRETETRSVRHIDRRGLFQKSNLKVITRHYGSHKISERHTNLQGLIGMGPIYKFGDKGTSN